MVPFRQVSLYNLYLIFILGTGIPEGSTAYVLSEDDGQYLIWNANTGQYYNVHDNFCPLISVGCVINDENVSTTPAYQLAVLSTVKM